MRLIDADDFFRNYPELAIEPYINAPTVDNICPNLSDEEIKGFLQDLIIHPDWAKMEKAKEYLNLAIKALENKRQKGEWKVYGKQGDIPITDICSNCRYEMK